MIKKFIFILFGSFSLALNAQLTKFEHFNFIIENSDITLDSIGKFQRIYFVRFDYCGATEYCGKNKFVELIDESYMPNTLFVIDTFNSKSDLPLKMLNKKIIYVNRENMMRSGLFCGHTVLVIPKKRKVKWLD